MKDKGLRMNAELMGWLREQLAKAEQALKGREQLEECMRGGTDSSWRAVGCKLTKAQRLKEASVHGRIAAKYRRDVKMFQAVMSIMQMKGEARATKSGVLRRLEAGRGAMGLTMGGGS